jgi:transcriptional regulator with XRE-family HTH domain
MDAAVLLRTVRSEAGLTLRELAAIAGTSHSTLSAYEHGAKTPTVDTLDRIVRAAGFALDTELRRRHRGDPALTRGDELVAVLRLAAAFPVAEFPVDTLPAGAAPRLDAPVFGRR